MQTSQQDGSSIILIHMKQHFYGKRNHTFQSLYLTTVSPSKMSMPSFFMNISAILSLFLMKSKEFFLSFKFWITVHDFLVSQNIQLFNIWVYFIHVQKKYTSFVICFYLLYSGYWNLWLTCIKLFYIFSILLLLQISMKMNICTIQLWFCR